MATPNWQLNTPLSAIIFDCDGTLNRLEGIDYLADARGVGSQVKTMTSDAMSKTGLNPVVFQQRLNLVNPTLPQLHALGQAYFSHRVPDIDNVIRILQRLQKSVYVVSAGINPAVQIFGELLSIPRENIYAVDLMFDDQGTFLDFEKTSPLINNSGKRVIISELKKQHEHIMHIGDGMNDLVTKDLVTRFIGYGGVFYRENIAAACDYYISTLSLAPLLPLILTLPEVKMLGTEELKLYQKGLDAIENGLVKV